ncbi:MAG: TIM barrel protein [Candidatus Latescibacterota bacterium]|jgi:sugar phosphate isomerase/epimerase
MRLGGPIFEQTTTPSAWVAAVRAKGYKAAYCPLTVDDPPDLARGYQRAAVEADIVIAEVGAWCNPLGPDIVARKVALAKCKRSLELAERIGARCCVNIAGSRGAKWDGPHPDDLTPEFFDEVVACVQEIVDAVAPQQTRYTLETMPWMPPDSADGYLRLLRSVDRPGFAAHLDPVNLVNSPQRYFRNRVLLRECFEKLGPHVRSVHAKDILLADRLTVHLDEVRPGTGGLDYPTFLREISRLDPDTPLMLEHLPNEAEYDLAAAYLRQVAAEMGCTL